MATTRESSPAQRSGSSSPAQLTPTSKVKAMLAAFDDEHSSDEDVPASGSARERLLATLKKTESSKLDKSVGTSTLVPKIDGIHSKKGSGSEDEEEDIIRPKGRMAARMHTNGTFSSEDNDSDILPRKARISPTKSKSPRLERPIDTDASDENDTPVISRKRKIRAPRQETPESSPSRESASPGLFVSPEKPASAEDAVRSDSDNMPTDLAGNSRFQALVQKKRAERLAKEAEIAKEKAKRAAELKQHAAILEGDRDLDSDDEAGRRLTQQSRPSRKASKKALEEMHRETQRMSRNQQLAHNAITKKKVTKASLFAKFNFKPANQPEDIPDLPRPSSSSSAAPHSDVEMKDTPPTSPAVHESDIEKAIPSGANMGEHQASDEQPAMEEQLSLVPSSPSISLNKGKGKAVAAEPTPELVISKKREFTQKPIRVRPPKPENREPITLDDSDSDLEIVTDKTSASRRKLDLLFDGVPAKQAKESRPIYTLKMLAHLTSPNEKSLGRKSKPGMTTTELQVSLQQRARQQAAREREERLQALRAKGVIIQTAEEREKEMAEVDDMLSKARQEAEEIGKREKAAAKKERKENGGTSLMDDSSDDEDWKEEGEKVPEDISISGSDEEEGDEASEEDVSDEEEEEEEEHDIALDEESTENPTSNPLFDNEADETEDDDAEAELSADDEMAKESDMDGDEEDLPIQNKRKPRKSNVILDDEDESEEEKRTPPMPQTNSPRQRQIESPATSKSVLRSATKTFIPGLTITGPAGLGLTQIFAGTMDESQIAPTMESPSHDLDAKQDSMSFLRRIPAPTLPPFLPTMTEETQDVDMAGQSQESHIPESQQNESMANGVDLHFSQSQLHEFDSLVTATQLSQFPDATQDAGFTHMTPIKGRFVDAPPSTVETMVLEPTAVPETTEETPIVKKKGKLRRRVHVAAFSDEEDNADSTAMAIEEDDFDITANVFDVMRKASKKKVVVDEFDKKKSAAKEMVHEQAEESEDEYAGLGGASDDESGGEEDAFVKEMIDDEGGKAVDERKLAAFFADRERASDEKQVEKLYNDITKGMLRRKRGADYELSDSDDGGEARQRRKRKEFAKRQKALLADERIGKIAENPKRQAFLRAIEDHGSEDEMDFLGDFDEEENTESQPQSQSQAEVVPDSQPTEMGPPKRKADNDWEGGSRPAPHLRRTKQVKKPANLSEIRESLSSLIEEPNAMVAPTESDSDSDGELEIEGEDLGSGKEKNKENRDPFALRRTNVSIIDRISLKRESSSSVSNGSRLAFAAPSSTAGFKVPLLLRRATTNSSIASSTSSGVSGTERTAGGEKGVVKRGGSKGSGVNYFARESERRAAVVKTEKRREQKLVKGAQVRRKVVGGMLGGGKFE